MNTSSIDKPSLLVHEWIAVVILLVGMAALVVISGLNSQPAIPSCTSPPIYLTPQHVEVCIEGAVEHPGTYVLERGSTMEHLLQQAVPLANADTKRLKPQAKLRNGQTVKIKEKGAKRQKKNTGK